MGLGSIELETMRASVVKRHLLRKCTIKQSAQNKERGPSNKSTLINPFTMGVRSYRIHLWPLNTMGFQYNPL